LRPYSAASLFAKRPIDFRDWPGKLDLPVHRCSLIISLLLLVSLAGACTVFPPPERAKDPVGLPARYHRTVNGSTSVDAWWRSFGSQELNRLMEAALKGNFDLRSAWARLRQARAEAVKARAGLFPALDASLEGSKTRTYADRELISDREAWSLGLAASYELDLWGKLSSENRSEILTAEAAQGDVRTSALSLAGELALAWVDLLAIREEARVLRGQIRTNEDLLRLQVVRFEKGSASALEVTQQRELLASSKSDLPSLKAREQLALNRLALLVGRADPQAVHIEQESLPRPIPLPGAGIPADLLAKRPDVRAAFLRLQASDWEVSAARADRLPRLNLSARAALSSDGFQAAWGDWLTSLSGDLVGPLLDAGLRKAEVERSKAVAEERLAAYAATVLEAVREVQDALANEAGQRERVSRLQEELRAAEQARRQARLRYLKGQSDFLNYLTEQRSVQSLERRLIVARADLVSFRVALYRALGGGWESLQAPRPRAY